MKSEDNDENEDDDEASLLLSDGEMSGRVWGLRRAGRRAQSAFVHSVNLHDVGGAAHVHDASNDDDCFQASRELVLN